MRAAWEDKRLAGLRAAIELGFDTMDRGFFDSEDDVQIPVIHSHTNNLSIRARRSRVHDPLESTEAIAATLPIYRDRDIPLSLSVPADVIQFAHRTFVEERNRQEVDGMFVWDLEHIDVVRGVGLDTTIKHYTLIIKRTPRNLLSPPSPQTTGASQTEASNDPTIDAYVPLSQWVPCLKLSSNDRPTQRYCTTLLRTVVSRVEFKVLHFRLLLPYSLHVADIDVGMCCSSLVAWQKSQISIIIFIHEGT